MDLERRSVDFEYAENFTIGSSSVLPQKKQSGDENIKKENCEVNSYKENEADKSKDKNERKQKENTSKKK